MDWFRKSESPQKGQPRKDIPDGLWTKCKNCGEIIYVKELEKYFWVCNRCDFHFKISSHDYIKLILDDGKLDELASYLVSSDPLGFRDTKRYTERIKAARKKSGLNEAVICGAGKINSRPVSFAVMAFNFIGGSMGSGVGEKVARTIEHSLDKRIPLVIVSTSGGARMQEGILSLMQMAKTSALLAMLYDEVIPFISVLTNPTTAGVMASYASLGDIIIAEPQALLGFAGQRVIKQTIGQDLPEGFQSSEFFLERGFIDFISHRRDLKRNISLVFDYLRVKDNPV